MKIMKIQDIYDGVIKDLHQNNYTSFQKFSDIIGNEEDCKKFIFQIIVGYRKGHMPSSLNIKELTNYRLSHVVSCFLMGYWLYIKFFRKKGVLDSNFFKKELDMKSDEAKIKVRDKFLFLWAITCLYHDAGYVYEEGGKCMMPDFSILDENDRPKGISTIYSMANIRLYELLRRNNHGKQDHGIYGALKLRQDFNNILGTGISEDQAPPEAYNCAVWSIMCHNIWFCKPDDHCVSCYKAKGLHAFVMKNAREKMKISEHPFLYLLSLADNLEPYKKVTDMNLWEKIDFIYGERSSGLNIKISDRTSDSVMKYIDGISKLDYWLVEADEIEKNREYHLKIITKILT